MFEVNNFIYALLISLDKMDDDSFILYLTNQYSLLDFIWALYQNSFEIMIAFNPNS